MMTMLKIITLALLIQYTLNACICSPRGSMEQEFEAATSVWEGKVLEKRKLQDQQLIKMMIINGFKSEGTQVEVATPASNCDFDFQEGERYIVFATSSGGPLVTTRCDYTQLSSLDLRKRLFLLADSKGTIQSDSPMSLRLRK
jgi:hypothetical protein